MVSNKGRFINKEGNILRDSYDSKGYLHIKMVNEKGERITLHSHRLVATLFVPNDDPTNKKEVNHKNLIKDDNSYQNLEWVTRIENVKHAQRNFHYPSKKRSKKEIIEICLALESNESIGEIIERFNITDKWLKSFKKRKIYGEFTKDYNF